MFLKGTLFGYVSRKPLSASHIPNMNSDLAYVSPSQSPVSMSMPFSLYIQHEYSPYTSASLGNKRNITWFTKSLMNSSRVTIRTVSSLFTLTQISFFERFGLTKHTLAGSFTTCLKNHGPTSLIGVPGAGEPTAPTSTESRHLNGVRGAGTSSPLRYFVPTGRSHGFLRARCFRRPVVQKRSPE